MVLLWVSLELLIGAPCGCLVQSNNIPSSCNNPELCGICHGAHLISFAAQLDRHFYPRQYAVNVRTNVSITTSETPPLILPEMA